MLPQATDVETELDWMLPPRHNKGLFGLLRAGDAEMPLERSGRSSGSVSSDRVTDLLPLGTIVRARFVHCRHDGSLLTLLDACDASCALSLLATGPPTSRLPGILARGQGSSTEWPIAGIERSTAVDPHFANKRGLLSRVQLFGLGHLHSSLLSEIRDEIGARSSKGRHLSQLQSRAWADRRVREGISRARAGDQKGALERYEAALALWPRHKEGLVGRGAALVNVGRPKEALRDFDAALALHPGDTNATKYREIARRRLRDNSVSDHTVGREQKRRRSTGGTHGLVVVR